MGLRNGSQMYSGFRPMLFGDEADILPIAELEQHGWVIFDLEQQADLQRWVVKAASSLGEIAPTREQGALLDRLIVRDAGRSPPNSLSSRFGGSGFPMHMDTAHWPTPCHFVILGCVAPGDQSRSTTLTDWRQLKLDDQACRELFTAPFRVTNGRQSFYSSILSVDRVFVRYDMSCMSPASDAAKGVSDTVAQAIAAAPCIRIEWKHNRVVILDNWRMLHGRGASNTIDSDRLLVRALVR